MHVPGCEFENRSSYIQGNWGKNDRVVVEFKAKVDVESCSVYSLSVSDNCFGSLVQKNKKRE